MENPHTSPGLLFVVGRTRIGKGRFIQTAVHVATGTEIKAAAPGLVSDTRIPQKWPIIIGGRPANVVDTVGYDDSSGTNVGEETFLRLLSQTETSLFYPPLVIISDLGATTGAWLKKMMSVFPEILVAVRGSSTTFSQAADQLISHGVRPLELFHLPEFLEPGEDQGNSFRKYREKVSEILAYYAPLNATRDRLQFDSKLFQGQEEEIKVDVETKTEEKIEEELITQKESVKVIVNKTTRVEDGGHKELVKQRRDPSERASAAFQTWPLLGVGGWGWMETVTKWVAHFKEIVSPEETMEQIEVTYKKRIKQRVKFERTQYEVWRILCDGTRIFKGHRKDDWRQVDIQNIKITYDRMMPTNYQDGSGLNIRAAMP